MVVNKHTHYRGHGVFAENERGYTLVELMIGIVLLSMLSISFFTLFTTLVRSALIIKRKAVASTLATTQMEYLKSLPYDSLAIQGGSIATSGTPLPSQTFTKVNGITYTTTTTIDYADDAFDGCGSYPTTALKQKYCRNYPTDGTTPANDTNPKDYKIVHISVFDANHYTLAQVDTEVSARVAETASTTGAIFVQVLDSDNNPLQGATVHITNTTISPNVDISDSTDSSGYAIFFDVAPDTTNYDFIIAASKASYSTLTTIAPSGSLTPTYSNLRVFTQASSSLTMRLMPMTAHSLIMEATDVSGSALSGLKLYAKGGYKKYTLTTDTSYYFDNFTPSDNRPNTDGAGNATIDNLVPGPYYFCGDNGDTNCKIGNNTYYLAAAVPYGGTDSFNPTKVPVYKIASPPTMFTLGSDQYVQKVRLIFSNSASFPRIKTITPDEASLGSGTLSNFAFTLTGVNLPCNASAASCATAVRLLQGGSTYTASCTGNASPATALNCKVNISAASMGATQLQIANSGGTLTIPASLSLGGITVVN